MPKPGRVRTESGEGKRNAAVEWVGGRFTLPYTREDPPQRPELGLWLELPSGLVAGYAVLDQAGRDDALASALENAMNRPVRGASRRPSRLRVADAGLAGEVRRRFGERFAIDVAPTPELDEVFEHFLASTAEDDGDDVSYLEGGRVSALVVARMFRAASVLFRCAPWRVASDSEVLRADIPALGVEGACISIIGALGESLGIIVFPSLLAYERFGDLAAPSNDRGQRLDLGGPILSMDLWRASEVPTGLRREAASHGWTTASPDAFPIVTHRDRDGMPRPTTERDLQIATVCALAVASFFVRHPEAFGGKLCEPLSESITTDDEGVTVRLTAPYEAYEAFEPSAVAAPSAARLPPNRGKVGRNDACPCGSGKKYKKCCLRDDEGARQQDRQRANVHEIDERVVRELHEFAFDRYGEEFMAAVERFKKAAGGDEPALVQLRGPCSVYEACIDGERPIDAFLEDHGGVLSPEERDWLTAQAHTSVSIWEVASCEPGVSVTVVDLLSGERRAVREVRASRDLVARDAVLARVVDYGGASYFCGMHPRLLPPEGAAAAIASFRKSAGARAPNPGQRPDEKRTLSLVRAWAKAVRQGDEAAAAPKELVNTDGEPLLVTTDHFEFEEGSREAVRERLLRVEGLEHESDEGERSRFTIFKKGNAIHAHWDNTVLAHVVLEGRRLRLEANSVQRADRLRARLETACGWLLRHRVREHGDPLSRARPPATPKGPAHAVPPEALDAVRELKARHYASWADTPIPALDGKTPRQAVQTKRGRERVDVLLRTMENAEQRSRDGAAFDFAPLRRSLDLEE